MQAYLDSASTIHPYHVLAPSICLTLCSRHREGSDPILAWETSTTGRTHLACCSPGTHLDHLEHFDGRIPEAVFPQERADGVDGLVHLSQEVVVGLEKPADELVQVPSWGLVEECWLQRERVGWVSQAGSSRASCLRMPSPLPTGSPAAVMPSHGSPAEPS